MNLGISTQNNGNKPLVLKKAEYDGHTKYLGYSDGWIHKENGCNGILSPNGKPGHFDCKCGAAFRKQPMLNTQIETRSTRSKDLLPTVYLEHRNDKIGLLRFVVASQSRPKKYQVIRDNHGNWSCCCEDWSKHRKYDDWHCKHVLACEYWLENEAKSRERTVNSRPSIRPSLICTGTQDEFEKANSLDEKQIVQMNNGCTDGLQLAYLINGKVAISYYGTLKLAGKLDIEVSDIQTKEAATMIVATAKAHNPHTGVTQCGAHSQQKLISGRPDPDAEVKAAEKAKRNAILKVVPEYTVYDYANKHAQTSPFDYLDAYFECCRVFTQNGLGEWHVGDLVKDLFPHKKPAELGRDEWIEVYRACQRYADELDANPDVEKQYWAKTKDGDVVLVTETGDDSPAPRCRAYYHGYCTKCVGIDQKQFHLGLCNLPRLRKYKAGCNGDANSDACQHMAERYPFSFGDTPDWYKERCYKDGRFNMDWWKDKDYPPKLTEQEQVEETDTEAETEKLSKVYVVKTERGRWALAKDDGNGFSGEILTEGGGETYPVPLNDFKGIREASVYAKKHYPDAKVVITQNI